MPVARVEQYYQKPEASVQTRADMGTVNLQHQADISIFQNGQKLPVFQNGANHVLGRLVPGAEITVTVHNSTNQPFKAEVALDETSLKNSLDDKINTVITPSGIGKFTTRYESASEIADTRPAEMCVLLELTDSAHLISFYFADPQKPIAITAH